MEGLPFSLCVLVSGNGSNLQSIIDHIENKRLAARILCVISNNENAYAIERARIHGIPYEIVRSEENETRQEYDQRLSEIIDRLQPDLIVLAGFMRILGDEFVNRYTGRMINIHPSLLPKYRGLNTHQRVIDAADATHGASVHFVTQELDGGPLIMQSRLSVKPDDTKDTLAARVLSKEHVLYPTVIGMIADGRITMREDRVLLNSKPIEDPLQLENNSG